MKLRIFILSCLIGGCFGVEPVALTSENNFKLKAVYDAVPKTDANRDGILTLQELSCYVEEKFRDRATSRTNPYLGQFLKNEPASDINHDGVLTKFELLAHLKDQGDHYAALN